MRKFLMIGIVVVAAIGAAAYFGVFSSEDTAAAGPGGGQQVGAAQGGRGGRGAGGASGAQRPQQQGGAGGFGGPGGGGGGPRLPLTVEMAAVKRGDLLLTSRWSATWSACRPWRSHPRPAVVFRASRCSWAIACGAAR